MTKEQIAKLPELIELYKEVETFCNVVAEGLGHQYASNVEITEDLIYFHADEWHSGHDYGENEQFATSLLLTSPEEVVNQLKQKRYIAKQKADAEFAEKCRKEQEYEFERLKKLLGK